MLLALPRTAELRPQEVFEMSPIAIRTGNLGPLASARLSPGAPSSAGASSDSKEWPQKVFGREER